MKQTICDMCEEPILLTEASVKVGEWDFHDRPECLGEFQAGTTEAKDRSKTRRAEAKNPPKNLPGPTTKA